MTREGPRTEVRVSTGPAEVRLPEAPTTGYRWSLPDPPPAVSLERTDYEPPARDREGGEGERIFFLRVTKEGTFDLEFHLGRSFEAEAVERRTVTLIAE